MGPWNAGSSRQTVVIAAIVISIVALVPGCGDDSGESGGAEETIRGPSADSEVTTTIAVGGEPLAVAATDAAVWVTGVGSHGGTVLRIDPATDEVTATIPVDDFSTGLAATATAVWVSGNNTVSRIDPATNEVTATIPVGNNPTTVAATETAVWVTNLDDATVSRIDPATNEVTATISFASESVGVAATDTAVWVTNYDGTVSRIDPATNEVIATIPVSDGPNGCQWSIGSARGRTVVLPAGGHQNCPVMATGTARGFRCRGA